MSNNLVADVLELTAVVAVTSVLLALAGVTYEGVRFVALIAVGAITMHNQERRAR